MGWKVGSPTDHPLGLPVTGYRPAFEQLTSNARLATEQRLDPVRSRGLSTSGILPSAFLWC